MSLASVSAVLAPAVRAAGTGRTSTVDSVTLPASPYVSTTFCTLPIATRAVRSVAAPSSVFSSMPLRPADRQLFRRVVMSGLSLRIWHIIRAETQRFT